MDTRTLQELKRSIEELHIKVDFLSNEWKTSLIRALNDQAKSQTDISTKLDYVLNTADVVVNSTPVAASQQTSTTVSSTGGPTVVTVVPKGTRKVPGATPVCRFKALYKTAMDNKNSEEFKLFNTIMSEEALAKYKTDNAASIESRRGRDKVGETAAHIWSGIKASGKTDIINRLNALEAAKAIAPPVVSSTSSTTPQNTTSASTSSATTQIAISTVSLSSVLAPVASTSSILNVEQPSQH